MRTEVTALISFQVTGKVPHQSRGTLTESQWINIYVKYNTTQDVAGQILIVDRAAGKYTFREGIGIFKDGEPITEKHFIVTAIENAKICNFPEWDGSTSEAIKLFCRYQYNDGNATAFSEFCQLGNPLPMEEIESARIADSMVRIRQMPQSVRQVDTNR